MNSKKMKMFPSVQEEKYLTTKSKYGRCLPSPSTGNFTTGHTKINNRESVCDFWFIIAFLPLLIIPVNSESIHIWKCCFKGENLHSNGRDCMTRPGQKVDSYSNVQNKSTLQIARNNPDDLYWLAPQLKDRDLSVHYGSVFICNKFLVLRADDKSRVSFDEDMNVTLRTIDGSSETVFETSEYCLDATDGPTSPWAIRFCTFQRFTQVDKCCPRYHVIVSKNGKADCAENLNITVNGSEAIRQMNINPRFAYNSFSLCTTGQFQIFDQPNIPQGFIKWFLEGKPTTVNGYFWRYMCMDARVKEEGNLDTALGYCSFSLPNIDVLGASKYLGVAAAALLAAAVTTTLAQKRTRDSTHGRALACHAGSLLFAQVANAVFNFGGEQHCQEIALVINFFLLAAAFWLQIICFNMARGFNQMLRAVKRSGIKTSGTKTFCFYSLYGWGCPIIATIVIVSTLSDYKFSAPLYHTKTCYYEEGHHSRTKKTSTLWFYYAPVCIILLLNIGMFLFIALKIRMMQKGTDILNRKGDGQPSGTSRSAVLYAKVLLVMGVVEALGDVAAWAWKDSGVRGPQGERLTDKAVVLSVFLARELSYRWAVYALDLLRAASVFALCCCGRRVRLRAAAVLTACLASCLATCRSMRAVAAGAKGADEGSNSTPKKSDGNDDEGRGGDGRRRDGGGAVGGAGNGDGGTGNGSSGDRVHTVDNESVGGEQDGSGPDNGNKPDEEAEAQTSDANGQLTILRRLVHAWMGRLLSRSEQEPCSSNQQRASMETVITVMDDSSRKFSAS